MPVPFNITLTPGAPYVSLFGGNGAGSWGEVFNSGTFGNWSEWTAIAAGPSQIPPPGAGFVFRGTNIAVYGTMQWAGEGYNITVTPNVPCLVETWPGCNPIAVCLSEPGVLWKSDNLTSDLHTFFISTNYNLGINTDGPTLSLTHIDITTSIPGDESSSHVVNRSILTSEFTLSPENQWMRASNGSLYAHCTSCTLSINFTGTAILLTTAHSVDGFSPYYATIDAPIPDIVSDSNAKIGVERRGGQDEGEVMYMATGLEDTNHILNIRAMGGFAISRAYIFEVGSRATSDGPATDSSSTAVSASSTAASAVSPPLSSNVAPSMRSSKIAFSLLLLASIHSLLP